jgi:hypothetical protein
VSWEGDDETPINAGSFESEMTEIAGMAETFPRWDAATTTGTEG